MAVEAVVCVVIQKLKDLEIQNEVRDVDEAKRILEGILEFMVDERYTQLFGKEEAFNKWLSELLTTIYELELVIETFSVRNIRKRKGFTILRSLSIEKDDSIKKSSLGYLEIELGGINENLRACEKEMTTLYISSGSHTTTVSTNQKQQAQGNQNGKAQENGAKTKEDKKEAKMRRMMKKKEKIEERKKQEEEKNAKNPKYKNNNNKNKSKNEQKKDAEQKKKTEQEENEEEEEEESTIFGLKGQLRKLLNQLTAEGKKKRIISVLGEGGSGRTTLVKTIYNRKKIKELFKIRAWVTVLRDHNVRDILVSILRQVSNSKDEDKLNNNALKERLSGCLEKNNYLIVMDDLRTVDVLKELLAALPEMLNGSRLVFTTTQEKLAWQADPGMRHKIQPLDDNSGEKLFLQKVPFPKLSSPYPHQHHYEYQLLFGGQKNKILELCGRLPLRILMLGGLLSTKEKTVEAWTGVLDKYKYFKPNKAFFQCSDILSFSYNELQPHLKLCFLYLGVFPKQFEISVRRLFWLWDAEGFVERSPETKPEDLVLEYLEELVKRNMVEISKRSDGSIKSCRMLGIFYEIFLPKMVNFGLFYVHRSLATPPPPPNFGLRRVVEHVDIEDVTSSGFENKSLLSYISFNVKNKGTRAAEIGNFLGQVISNPGGGFRLLRVLDLEGVYKPTLPHELGTLFNLRYLGLRSTRLTTLPPSVCKLPYLETLDIKHTYISILPSSVWKMIRLRHLCLSQTRIDKPINNASAGGRSTRGSSSSSSSSSVMQLQTLWGLFLDTSSKKTIRKISTNGLERMMNLRKLGVTSDPTSFEELGEWIVQLKEIEHLQLRSKGKLGQPSELKVPSMSLLMNLKRLHLIGKLVPNPPPVTFDYPPHLTVLTLSLSQLQIDPMPKLARLPNLTVLKLLANSYEGVKMDGPPTGFPMLRVLNLWMLKQLKQWVVAKDSMKNLLSLEIRCCDKLENIPSTLLKSSALKELILTNMPDRFVARVKTETHKRLTITVNNWEF